MHSYESVLLCINSSPTYGMRKSAIRTVGPSNRFNVQIATFGKAPRSWGGFPSLALLCFVCQTSVFFVIVVFVERPSCDNDTPSEIAVKADRGYVCTLAFIYIITLPFS